MLSSEMIGCPTRCAVHPYYSEASARAAKENLNESFCNLTHLENEYWTPAVSRQSCFRREDSFKLLVQQFYLKKTHTLSQTNLFVESSHSLSYSFVKHAFLKKKGHPNSSHQPLSRNLHQLQENSAHTPRMSFTNLPNPQVRTLDFHFLRSLKFNGITCCCHYLFLPLQFGSLETKIQKISSMSKIFERGCKKTDCPALELSIQITLCGSSGFNSKLRKDFYPKEPIVTPTNWHIIQILTSRLQKLRLGSTLDARDKSSTLFPPGGLVQASPEQRVFEKMRLFLI